MTVSPPSPPMGWGGGGGRSTFLIPVAYSYLKWGGIVPQKVILFGLILAKRLS